MNTFSEVFKSYVVGYGSILTLLTVILAIFAADFLTGDVVAIYFLTFVVAVPFAAAMVATIVKLGDTIRGQYTRSQNVKYQAK